jgi:hypothetical protein
MFFQQRQKLLLKGHFTMMLFLVFDVLDDFLPLRHTDAESPVLFLPPKAKAKEQIVALAA